MPMRLALTLFLAGLLSACAEGNDPLAYVTLKDGGARDVDVPVEDTGSPTKDTGATAKDTGATAKDTGGSTGCTPTSGKACDTFPQCGCAAGENCNVSTTGGDTKCFPTGTKGTHEKCSGNGQCDKGLQCVGNVCVPLCSSDTDCPTSGAVCRTVRYLPTGSTTPTDIPGFDICNASCNPLSPAAGCGTANCAIAYDDGTTRCVAAGTSKAKGGCVSDVFACGPGYTCINSADCFKWCRKTVASDCTGTGGTCTGFTTPLMKGGIEYGVCYF